MKLYVLEKSFTDAQTGETVVFPQAYIEQDGIAVAVKAVYKNDRRLLLVMARSGKE